MKFKESEKLELKKSTSELKEAIISMVAILNKYHLGTLYFGIKNNGTVIGQQASELTLRKISQSISEHIEPKIYPKIQSRKIERKQCIIVEFEGEDKPYFAFGRAYIRVADEDRQLSVKELEKLILKKNAYRSLWESEVSDIGVNEASVSAIRHFVNRANDAGRINYRYDNARNVLNKLGLVKNNKLLNAGKVLFCSNNPAEVQSAVFAGNDKITFLDIQNFRGNLFELIEKSESYIKEHINWRADLSGSRRQEIPEIPVRAIRETVINSLCHRDFNNPKGNEIAIFKNRVEIYNPGRFPDDHSPEEFIKGKERSILRNPLIANAFYLTSDIERWGSGLKRIYDACKESGIKVEFENLKTGFLVTFYRPEQKLDRVEGSGEVVKKGGQKTTQKILDEKLVEKLVEGLVEKLGENELKILKSIIENRNITTDELAKKLDISSVAVYKNVRKLKGKEIIKRIGPDKGGHWKIVDKK